MRKRSIVRIVALGLVLAAAVAGGPGSALGASATETNAAYRTAPSRAGGARSTAGLAAARAARNVNVTNKVGAQSETSIAVDPTNPNHILAASNDLSTFSSYNNVLESFDGGRTWASAGFTVNTFCYDPWLDFNADGDAFFAYECSDQRIAYKLAGTNQWVKTTLNNAGGFPDRDMVVVDRTPTSPFFGSVYIGYDDNASNNKAYVLYSRDGFGNWVRSPQINDSNALTIGVNVSVAPDGTVYATWLDFDNRKMMVDMSTDGGAHWGRDHVVHNFRINTSTFFIFIPPQPDRGVLPMPFTATSPEGTPHEGRLYVSYFDRPVGGGANTNAYVRYSDDGGVTWSSEALVNDDTVDAYHFHTAISVAEDGTVGVSFYDTRNDPQDKKTDQYIAFSPDGATWSPNRKITTAMSDESGGGDPNDYGDYQGLDVSMTARWWPVWTDSRPGNRAEEMYTTRFRA